LADAVSNQRHGTFEIDDGSGGHSWQEISNISRAAFGVPEKVIYIPKALALALGLAGDVVGKFRGKPSLLNSGQLRQVYHSDWRVKGQRWPLENPISIAKGLPETIRWYQAQGLLPLRDTADRRPSQQDTTG
jgi:hypothetical protein